MEINGVAMNIDPSPPVRSTILGSFLRGRPRGVSTTQTAQNRTEQHEHSPSPPASPPSPAQPPNTQTNNNHRRRSFAPTNLIIPQSNSNAVNPQPTQSSSLGISHILRRRRSTGQANNNTNATQSNASTNQVSSVPPPLPSPPLTATTPQPAGMPLTVPQLNRGTSSASSNHPNQTHRIRLVPHLDSRRTLRFEPITRDLKDDDPPLRIGRFTDRGVGHNPANLGSNKLAFKSKVVSRSHAEIWVESGKFFIRDTKSSSGTFLNHLRLSPAGHESRPYQLRDGDVLQLGVDYQGGSEDIYKSVKIKIEVGREWQQAANAFNTNAISQLKALAATIDPSKPGEYKEPAKGKHRLPKTSIPDCCICLFAVSIRQALFIAPCSHTFHYKCIRPLLEKHASAFSCPLCRSFADLDEDVEIEPEPEPEEDDVEWEDVGVAPSTSVPPPIPSTSARHLASSPPFARDGAETEVELDMIGSEHRARRQRPTMRTDGHVVPPPMDPVIDLSEHADLDAEMLDGEADDGELYANEGESQNLDGGAIVTRGPGFRLPLPSNSSGLRDDESEAGSADGGLVHEIVGPVAEPVLSVKRKR